MYIYIPGMYSIYNGSGYIYHTVWPLFLFLLLMSHLVVIWMSSSLSSETTLGPRNAVRPVPSVFDVGSIRWERDKEVKERSSIFFTLGRAWPWKRNGNFSGRPCENFASHKTFLRWRFKIVLDDWWKAMPQWKHKGSSRHEIPPTNTVRLLHRVAWRESIATQISRQTNCS